MASPPQLFVTITSPPGSLPTVDRTFQLGGNISWTVPLEYSLTGKSVTVQFGAGGPTVAATFVGTSLNWQCTGTVSPATTMGIDGHVDGERAGLLHQVLPYVE